MSVTRVRRDLELDVLQDRLGAAGRGDGGDGLECVEQLFAIAGDFHDCTFTELSGVAELIAASGSAFQYLLWE